MFEHSPSDRMQLLGMGDLRPPGSCMHCGSGNSERGYIDFDVFREIEGESYVCATCVEQAAEILGCLIADEASTLMADKLAAELKVEQLAEALINANERLAVYDSALSNLGNNAGSVFHRSISREDFIKKSNEERRAEQASISDADAGESEPAEPVINEGPAQPNGDAASHRPRRQFSL